MRPKLVTLDRRNNGHGFWKYYVKADTFVPKMSVSGQSRRQYFFEWREWCWNTWGPSKEVLEFGSNDVFDNKFCSNAHWCWQNEQYVVRIYLKSDDEAALFMLRWA
jgi:hypothetical protein